MSGESVGEVMKKIFAIIFVTLLSASYAHALAASIQPPRMVLRIDSPGTASGFINVMNPNNETLSVEARPAGAIEFITTLSEINFTLEPNETKRIAFDVNVTSSGTYNGEIIFAFRPPEGQGIGLASQIIIIATSNATATTTETTITPTPSENENPFSLDNPAVIIAGLIIIFAVVFLVKRRMK
jgi:hypothetical protein